jgi:hypothetical protein
VGQGSGDDFEVGLNLMEPRHPQPQSASKSIRAAADGVRDRNLNR